MQRHDRWKLPPSACPPESARRAIPALEQLEGNPVAAFLHHKKPKMQGHRQELPRICTGQFLLDMWLAGVSPKELATGFCGYHAARGFRDELTRFCVGGGLFFLALAYVPWLIRSDQATGPNPGPALLIGALAILFTVGRFHFPWMALFRAELRLDAERKFWLNGRKSAQVSIHELLMLLKWMASGLGALALGIGFYIGMRTLGLDRYADSLGEALNLFFRLLGRMPLGLGPFAAAILCGFAAGHLAGFALRRLFRNSFATCVSLSESIMQNWLESLESAEARR